MALIPGAQPMSPEPPAPQGGIASPDAADDAFTPEQNEQFEKGEVAVKRMLYDGGVIKDILDAIDGAPDKGKALADAVQNAIGALDDRTGGQIDPEVLIGLATMVLLPAIIKDARDTGIELSTTDVAAGIKLMLLESFRQGGLDEQQVQQASAEYDVQAIAQALSKAEQDDAPADKPQPKQPQKEPM